MANAGTRGAEPAGKRRSMARSRDSFDVVVVGGGVVGCAVFRRFVLEGANALLVEKGADLLSGASKANSAILHTGFDAPPDSIELTCMKAGYLEYHEIRERLGLPLLETGAMIVAWNEEELARLAALESVARQNGVVDVALLDAHAVRSREQHLDPSALGGLLVPGEHVIDPWSAPLAYARQGVANGGTVFRQTEVSGGVFDGRRWALDTTRGRIGAGLVVNCAGLWGDVLDERLTGRSEFSIRPRRGEFVVFDKLSSRLLKTIILPVPTDRTKGIVLTPTIFGNLLIGPTADDQPDRDRAPVNADTLMALVERAREIVPALRDVSVTATYAGLRPATEKKEYRIRYDAERNLMTVGGIRSTGLTASLGLARHVFQVSAGSVRPLAAPSQARWPKAPNLAEHLPREWRQPGHGGIVCHCEMVTCKEIEDALTGLVPAPDMAGLKRRTRAGMGRCQGFYCQAEVAALAAAHFDRQAAAERDDG